MKKLLITFSILAFAFAAESVATKHAGLKVESANLNDLQIKLESNADVYGLQLDVNYDDSQIQLTEDNITHLFTGSDVRSGMSVFSKVKEPGLARVIIFDLGGNAIINANNAENVLQLTYDNDNAYSGMTTITITNIVAAGAHGEEVGIKTDSSKEVLVGAEGSKNVEITHSFLVNDGYTPYETSIVANYPNPFNPTTTIEFDLAKAGFVDVTIYDLQGRKVVNLYNGNLDKAQGYTFNWDASNIASGQYFARITAPGFSDVINMTLLK